MAVDRSYVLDLLGQGEGPAIEFKREQTRPENIAREIVALANAGGGTILLGVTDGGAIEGVCDLKQWEERIANIARHNVIPSIDIGYFPARVEDKNVVAVIVSKGRDKPYQTTDGKYYVRVGSTNRIATQSELLRLFQAAGTFHYDLTPVPGTGIKDLNFSKLDNYFSNYNFSFSREGDDKKQILLQNTDILTNHGSVTIAGLLLFGSNPSKHLPQNGISFAHFREKRINEELIDKQNIDGNLEYQVDTGMAVLRNRLPRPSKIVGAKRVNTTYGYPDKVFRELLTNAVVHRNYAIVGSRIRLFLFQDRLEVISPGRLPNTVTVEKLRYGVSYATNPVIVKFMENMGYIDQLGRGLPMVYQEALNNGKTVVFEEIGEEFKVTLPISGAKAERR
jgi:ATP-dependent DNA helicase RecG